MSALKYWLWLSTLRGLGNQTRLSLLRRFPSPEEIYYADEGELLLTEASAGKRRRPLPTRACVRRKRSWPIAPGWTFASSPFRMRNIPDG